MHNAADGLFTQSSKFILDKPAAHRLVIIVYISFSEEEKDDGL